MKRTIDLEVSVLATVKKSESPERKLFLEKWCKELVKQGLKI